MLPDIDGLPSHAVSTDDQTSDDQLLANMPHLADRVRHHTKKLWGVSQASGSIGVTRYKERYPEAKAIQVKSSTVAYQAKPAGYDDYLATLAVRWLADEKAVASTNGDDVQALNERFGTSRFNPANHFSKPISKRTKAKIHEAFTARGIPLDMAGINSMSDVRRAAKAAQAVAQAGSRSFGGIGTRTDNQLLSGRAAFAIMKHHAHDSIIVPVDGSRVWLRLDALEEFVRRAGLVAGGCTGEGNFSDISSIVDIGGLLPEADSPDFDPLAAVEIGGLLPSAGILQSSELEVGSVSPQSDKVVDAQAEPSFKERVAALVAAQPQSTTYTHDPDTDPLTL